MGRPAPIWSNEQLEAERHRAIAEFRRQRMEEPLEQYLAFFDEYRSVVEGLLKSTADLKALEQNLPELLTDPRSLEAVRYLTGPATSLDDLRTTTDSVVSKKRVHADVLMVGRIMSALRAGLDRRRFPWLVEGREATQAERQTAAVASAALIANSKTFSSRRNKAKTTQELCVCDALRKAGFQEVPRRKMPVLADAPRAGEFCGESPLAGRNADVVVGLWDRRVMPIECKVSNSFVNSVKRLNNDAASKAESWRRAMGDVQVVPTAVLSGTYKLGNLLQAQNQGLTLFWAHDLESMLKWIDSAR